MDAKEPTVFDGDDDRGEALALLADEVCLKTHSMQSTLTWRQRQRICRAAKIS